MEEVSTVVERSEAARQEWFKKVHKNMARLGSSKMVMQDIMDNAAQDYNKVFGRLGMHPLMHLKGGKKRPRVILERDEVMAIYKPPLWHMGGSQDTWRKNVDELVRKSSSLAAAEEELLKTDKITNLQEWFVTMQGQLWMDREQEVAGWGFIQRLDGETDGPVVTAKTWRAQRALQAQMKSHLLGKAYLCLVHGRLENKIQFIRKSFAELGNDAANAFMIEHSAHHDPFYEWSQSGRWAGRSVRMAETFVKPIAYYRREQDNTEYSLVYVNILTGITHQIRITMQSLGHPLVSDDRYLPREQALADLKWCPRNFLTEVRSDWWDVCGPHKDPARRRYTRVSMENPLPLLFQGILETRLTLVEKLDPTADLYVGCRYWSLGDEQLMASFPKDEDFRLKVMRWCQRKGIHLDAAERLLQLPKEEIHEVLNNYLAPGEGGEDEAAWVCTQCMDCSFHVAHWNHKKGTNVAKSDCCGMLLQGSNRPKECQAKRRVDEGHRPAKGWLNFTSDPTIHLLFQVNKRWLEHRRKILKTSRPVWEVPPNEAEGTPCAGDLLTNLEDALVLNAKGGGQGIHEYELAEKVPGCRGIELPLGEPPEDSKAKRVRLPGKGTGAQWTYCLKGKDLAEILHKGELSIKARRLTEPCPVKEDPIPEGRIIKREEKERAERAAAAREKKRTEREREAKEAAERERAAAKATELNVQSGGGALSSTVLLEEDQPAKRRKIAAAWARVESKSSPGSFYYFNSVTGENRADKPPSSEEAQNGGAGHWERLESKSNPGQYYYHNPATGETSVEKPSGVTKFKEEPGIAWERRESNSKPGNFYYFNPSTGDNEINPPRVDPPWKLLESSSKKGQFYYFNEETRLSTENPPRSARPAKKPEPAASPAASEAPPGAPRPAAGQAGKDEKLPPGWARKESDKYPGKFYYVSASTNETSWTKPVWERKESQSNPGKVYYVHVVTGETSWEKPNAF